MDPTLINFSLTDLGSVGPWGAENRLHWFGLTDGSYWMQAGPSTTLFQYTTAGGPREHPELAYVSYYIARFWEDLLELLPRVLHEVPSTVEQSLKSRSPRQLSHASEVAASFLSARALDCGYLVNPPCIWIWSCAGSTTIRWTTRIGGAEQPSWTAGKGMWEMPTTRFISEVKDFDQRLMARMEERVEAVVAGALDPAIEIDLQQLQREQHDRSTWLSRALSTDPARSDVLAGSPDWTALERDLVSI